MLIEVSGQPSLGFADQMTAVFCLLRCLPRRKGSVDVKEIIIHMACSVRYFSFHSKQGTAIFSLPKNTNKKAKQKET